jgi:hypothetical protein
MFRKRKPDETRPDSPGSVTRQQPEATIPEDAEAGTTAPLGSPSSVPELHRPDRHASRSDSIGGATFSRYAAAENDLIVDKLQLVLKWGGEPTHSARYQSADLGANMRDDFKLLNRRVFDDVRVFTSSEKRVRTTAQIWTAAFLGRDDVPEDFCEVRKDLLDDSNAAKDVMDTVKRKLKHLLREGNSVPEQFAWPKDVPEPFIVMQTVTELLRFHRAVMKNNFKKLSGGAMASLSAISGGSEVKDGAKESKEVVDVASIQSRWCTGEDPDLFRERWEKLFSEFCDTEKADPSKVSELYDTMKYDALHNRQFLEWVFTPTQKLIDEFFKEEVVATAVAGSDTDKLEDAPPPSGRHDSMISIGGERTSFAQKIGIRRKSMFQLSSSAQALASSEQDASYFKLYSGSGDSKLKQDKRLGRLRDLFRYAKILFDYICPQEYGISDHEKLEIGLLTSLPLLREIVSDLEELQAGSDPKSFIYVTKEVS